MSMQSGPRLPESTGSWTFLSPASTITLLFSATTRSWSAIAVGKQQLSHSCIPLAPQGRERDESPGPGTGWPETPGAGNADGRLRGRRREALLAAAAARTSGLRGAVALAELVHAAAGVHQL